MSIFTDFLLKIARKILQEVLEEVTNQINKIQNDVVSQLASFVQTVVGGAWIGPDADRFINEVNTALKPKVEEQYTSIMNLRSGIEQASVLIVQVDTTSANMVAELEQEFAGVY